MTSPWDVAIKMICEMPLFARAGEVVTYTPTTSWMLLAEVLERLTGRPHEETVRQRVLEPLGMGEPDRGPDRRHRTSRVHFSGRARCLALAGDHRRAGRGTGRVMEAPPVGSGHGSAARGNRSAWQDIGLLILCAGVDCQKTATSLRDEHFRAVMQVNCGGHLSLIREVAKACRGRWRVVAVSSDVVSNAGRASLVYSASKAALEVGVHDAVADCGGHCDAVILRLPFLGWPLSNSVGEPGPAEMGSPLRLESLVRLIQSCLAVPFQAGVTRFVEGSVP